MPTGAEKVFVVPGHTALVPLIKQLGDARRLVAADAVLLAANGSAGETAVTVAVLVSVPAALVATLTMMVMDTASIEPRAKFKLVVPLTVPCDGTAETNVVRGGSGSTTVTDVAWSG